MTLARLYLQTDWIADDRVLKYTVYSVNAGMMQNWHDDVLTAMRSWDRDDTIRILFDLTHPNVSMSYFVMSYRDVYNAGITRDGKAEFLEFLDEHSQVDVKLALMLSHTMIGALSKYLPVDYEQPNFMGKIFFEESTATAWLTSKPGEDGSITGSITSHSLSELVDSLEINEVDVFGDRDYLRMMVDGSLEVVPIREGRPIIIGRSADCDLDLSIFGSRAKNISRNHAQLSLSNGRLTIIDLNSTNGTYIGGKKIKPGKAVYIRRDDVIRLGRMSLSVIF